MKPMKSVYLWQTIAALGFAASFSAPAHAWDPSRLGQPGTFETIMCIKLPGVYCPTPPAKESATAQPLPQTGSVEAWRRAKFPWLYPTSATSTGPIGYYPAQGTPEWFRCYKLGDCRKPQSSSAAPR